MRNWLAEKQGEKRHFSSYCSLIFWILNHRNLLAIHLKQKLNIKRKKWNGGSEKPNNLPKTRQHVGRKALSPES